MRRYTLLTIITVVATGILVFWLTQRDWLLNSLTWKKAQGALIDQRYRWRGERAADTNIVLVGLDASSMTLDALSPEEIQASPTLKQMKNPYPWDRGVYAAVLEKLMSAGARVVVFDFVFTGSKEGDKIFAEVLEKYRDRVVLASVFEPNEGTYKMPAADLLQSGMDDSVGLASVWADDDGITRRGRYRPSLARESPELKKFASQYPDDLIHMSALAVKKFAGSVDTPPYDHDNFIDFQGRGKTYVPVPVEKLFVDKLWKEPPVSGATHFRNKIVIVGPIANIFHDVHNTPFDEMPGPELQAQMVATLLNHSSLDEPSPAYNKILTLGMVVLALAICLFVQNAMLKPVLLIGTSAGFVAACQFAFSHAGVVVTMMPPLFGFVSTGSIGIVLQFFLEQIERRRYRNVLERYVSKNVAKTILEDQRSFEESLSGQKKPVAVLFSDIRGFTSMTEGREPEQLVKQLNEYFKEMVGVVLQENGTLQKFIGDAIMAAWGDAHSDGPEQDTWHAVRSALKMRAELAKLNARWAIQSNREVLHIGIGVNHGETIVGNIGSPERMEFTVLGDGVNLAARLETATKQFQADLLVGGTVEELTRKHFVFRRVGLLTVKGKSQPVEAFYVLSERTQPEPPWLGHYHEAIQLFRQRQFESASAMFKMVLAEIGGKDFLCEMYLEWCNRYLQTPPPENWNGSFILSEK